MHGNEPIKQIMLIVACAFDNYRNKQYLNDGQSAATISRPLLDQPVDEDGFGDLKLDDLDVIATLGIGGFGRVDLVRVTWDEGRVFALKSCSKAFVRSTQQEQHINNERIVSERCVVPIHNGELGLDPKVGLMPSVRHQVVSHIPRQQLRLLSHGSRAWWRAVDHFAKQVDIALVLIHPRACGRTHLVRAHYSRMPRVSSDVLAISLLS